ncbi:MAG: hypothetical protein AB1397_01680 [bacterium]
MNEREFYNRVTNSKRDLIGEFLQILHRKKVPYCVIGGVAVNAYCEPMITLDFDCVVAGQIEKLKERLKERGFKVKTYPHTWEVTHQASDVRIQIQRDQRYQEFIKNAELHQVLGYRMKVAQKKDLLKSKVWAWQDPERDEIKRDKDLLDIKRVLQKYSELEELLGEEIKERLRG